MLEVELRIKELAWMEAIQKVEGRIADLEGLYRHQESGGLASEETRGEINAYRRVLQWLKQQVDSS